MWLFYHICGEIMIKKEGISPLYTSTHVYFEQKKVIITASQKVSDEIILHSTKGEKTRADISQFREQTKIPHKKLCYFNKATNFAVKRKKTKLTTSCGKPPQIQTNRYEKRD